MDRFTWRRIAEVRSVPTVLMFMLPHIQRQRRKVYFIQKFICFSKNAGNHLQYVMYSITKNTASDLMYKSEYKYPLYQKMSNAVFFIYKKKNSVQQETGTVNRAKK